MDDIKPETTNAITVTPATDAKKDPVEDLVIQTYEPKKNCRKCHGTGRIGFIEGDPNKPYYCNCIMKVQKALTPEQKEAVRKAKTTPTVITQDNTTGRTGPQGMGPCPAGVPGVEGTAGTTDA